MRHPIGSAASRAAAGEFHASVWRRSEKSRRGNSHQREVQLVAPKDGRVTGVVLADEKTIASEAVVSAWIEAERSCNWWIRKLWIRIRDAHQELRSVGK